MEMTTQAWSIVALLVTTLGAALSAVLSARKHDTAARATVAVVEGLRKGITDLSLGQSEAKALEDAIRSAATAYGVSDHVDEHLGEGLKS